MPPQKWPSARFSWDPGATWGEAKGSCLGAESQLICFFAQCRGNPFVPDTWYYADKNGQVGPLTLQELKATLSTFRNADASDVLVWRDGFSDWKPAKDVDELKGQAPPPPPLLRPGAPSSKMGCGAFTGIAILLLVIIVIGGIISTPNPNDSSAQPEDCAHGNAPGPCITSPLHSGWAYPYEEGASSRLCDAAIKKSAIHPSTVGIHSFVGYATKTFPTGERMVRQDFTAKNEFGLELTYTAMCDIWPDGKLDISISERQ